MAITIPRSSVLGFIIGVLPGAGATIASFLAYGMERNLLKMRKKRNLVKEVFKAYQLQKLQIMQLVQDLLFPF